MRAFLALVAISLSVTVGYAQQQELGQCGGQGWDGPTTCEPGLTCVKLNDWYSQCQNLGGGTTTTPPSSTTQPPTTTPPPSTTSTANPPTGTGPYQHDLGQCGGEGWEGPFECEPGLTCVVLNQWYSHTNLDNVVEKAGKDHSSASPA
ncbi:hypothetical protein AX16_007611 [Volvariella volvacea WC 439]|nr:hypothetical protein AX16_007611 [Volvariella volvacea WC 439]